MVSTTVRVDRSAPPGRTSVKVEERILPDPPGNANPVPTASVADWAWRRRRCHRVLVRHDLNRLSHIDQPKWPGDPPLRAETGPAKPVHVDVKKLGKTPAGRRSQGSRVRCGASRQGTSGPGWLWHPSTRPSTTTPALAYSEVLADEGGATSAAFWRRAEAFFRAHGIVVERVMTDNAFAYRGTDFSTKPWPNTGSFTATAGPTAPRPMEK